MQINATPTYDRSDNPTNCCPRFNDAGWDEVRLHFRDKPFLRAETRAIAHVPLNMGRVFARVQAAIDAAGAARPDHWLVLSRDPTAFSGEHLFAVDKPVPGEEMVTLSGDFLTKVFEGGYSELPGWEAELKDEAREDGHTPGAVWFFYTTCPKCAKTYGRNPVVGLVELLPEA